jgi:hypothetical protein
MSSDSSALPKAKPLLPLEEFMKLSDPEREAYVNEQLKLIGEGSLALLGALVEKDTPEYKKLYEKVSGQASSSAGLSKGRGGYIKHYGKQTRRKKTKNM